MKKQHNKQVLCDALNDIAKKVNNIITNKLLIYHFSGNKLNTKGLKFFNENIKCLGNELITISEPRKRKWGYFITITFNYKDINVSNTINLTLQDDNSFKGEFAELFELKKL